MLGSAGITVPWLPPPSWAEWMAVSSCWQQSSGLGWQLPPNYPLGYKLVSACFLVWTYREKFWSQEELRNIYDPSSNPWLPSKHGKKLRNGTSASKEPHGSQPENILFKNNTVVFFFPPQIFISTHSCDSSLCREQVSKIGFLDNSK